jgi:hypothetical protein
MSILEQVRPLQRTSHSTGPLPTGKFKHGTSYASVKASLVEHHGVMDSWQMLAHGGASCSVDDDNDSDKPLAPIRALL